MNELIVHDFNGWYAGQMFSRSTNTTPPVDMVFDTKTNTFLEEVPSISAKFDLTTHLCIHNRNNIH
jgi:hypothetical protein